MKTNAGKLSVHRSRILAILALEENKEGYRLGMGQFGAAVWGRRAGRVSGNDLKGLGMKMSVELKKMQTDGLVVIKFLPGIMGGSDRFAFITDKGRAALEESCKS